MFNCPFMPTGVLFILALCFFLLAFICITYVKKGEYKLAGDRQ